MEPQCAMRKFTWKRSKSREKIYCKKRCQSHESSKNCAKHKICKQIQQNLVTNAPAVRHCPLRPGSKLDEEDGFGASSEGSDNGFEASSEGSDSETETMFSRTRMYGGGPGSRRNLHPIELKLSAIEKIQGGGTISDVAKTMDLAVGLVSNWWLQRAEIQEKSETYVAKTLINEDENDSYNFYVLKQPYKPRAPKNKPEAVDQEAKNWPSVWEDLGVPSPSNQAKAIKKRIPGEEGGSLLLPLLDNKRKGTSSKGGAAKKKSRLARRTSTDSSSSQDGVRGGRKQRRRESSEVESDASNCDPSEEQLERHLNENTGEWSAELFLDTAKDDPKSLTRKLMSVRKSRKRSESSASRGSRGNSRGSKGSRGGSKGSRGGSKVGSKDRDGDMDKEKSPVWSCRIVNTRSSSEESGSSSSNAKMLSEAGGSRRGTPSEAGGSRRGTPDSLLRDSSPDLPPAEVPPPSQKSSEFLTNHIPPMENVSFSMDALLQKERSTGTPVSSTISGSDVSRPREERRSSSPNLDYIIEEAPKTPREPPPPKTPKEPSKAPKRQQKVAVKTEVSATIVKKEPDTPEKPIIVDEPVTPVLNFLEMVGSSANPDIEPRSILPELEDEEEGSLTGVTLIADPQPESYSAYGSPEKAVSPPSYPLALYKLEQDGDNEHEQTLPGVNSSCDIAQTSPINYNRYKKPKRCVPPNVGSKLRNLPGIRILPPSEQKKQASQAHHYTKKSVYQSSTSDVIIVPQPDPDSSSSLDIVEVSPDPDPTQPYQYIPNKQVLPYKEFQVAPSEPQQQQQPDPPPAQFNQQQHHQQQYQQQQHPQEAQDEDIEVIDDDVVLLSDVPDEYNYPPVEYYQQDSSNNYYEEDPNAAAYYEEDPNAAYQDPNAAYQDPNGAYYTQDYATTTASSTAYNNTQQYTYSGAAPRRMSNKRGGGPVRGSRGNGRTNVTASGAFATPPNQSLRGSVATRSRVRMSPQQGRGTPRSSPRGAGFVNSSPRGAGTSRGILRGPRPAARGSTPRGGPRMYSPRMGSPRMSARGSPLHRGPGANIRRPIRHPAPARARHTQHSNVQTFPVGRNSRGRDVNPRFQLNRNAGNTRGNRANFQQSASTSRSVQQPQPAHTQRPFQQSQPLSATRGFSAPQSPAQRGSAQSPSNRAAGSFAPARAPVPAAANAQRQRVSLQVTSDQIQVLKSLGIIR